MNHEIENLKNEKQVQSNLIKLKKEEIYIKKQTIEQYEKEKSNHKLARKKTRKTKVLEYLRTYFI